MKEKRNGFIFVETVVVLMIVILSLTMALSSFSLVIRKNNINKYYDRPNEIYALYYIMKLGTTNEDNYISPLTEFYVDKSECSSVMNRYLSDCTEVLEDMNIQYIGIISNIDEELENPSKYTNGVIEYFKHLQREEVTTSEEGEPVTSTLHYAIGVFYINREYYYASLVIEENE